ncbi:MAG: aldo/keto reductase [Deltaproteobacteria bacterium]|nr:aldo/keto reductase [Deltaproteobacteria bacterium]
MSRKTKDAGLTRREFVKTVGLAGLATMGASVTGAVAAEQPAGAVKAATVPQRKLGKTGVDVSILNLGCMIDTLNNQLLLKQALKWGVTMWDTAEAYGNGLSEEGIGRFLSRNPQARKELFLVTKLLPKGGNFTERLNKGLKRLQTDYVDLFFVHNISGINEMTPFKEWAAEMKKAGKFKFFGFSTHTNMEDCLLGAAKLDWIDAVMMTYNFRVMNTPKMQEAVNACAKSGVGLIAMKTQAGRPGAEKIASEAKVAVAERFLERGFTDKQAKLKVVWDNPQIASICSQMPNLTILSANVAAARDLTKLGREEFDSLRRYALETKADYCAGCGQICQDAVGGAVPVNEVMRCLMYHQYYGEPELARLTFAGLPQEARQRLTEVDYSPAEQACPHRLAIAALMRQAAEMLA